ncbi:hypothetical protein CASFOL_027446 [Castilleja foliolosa]|uniref:RING-CH-type domain-containing protein n=1 Tax=Castilleja foliolosa TaxID=1961234 RepID=A0ABD3CEU5_9LAMI
METKANSDLDVITHIQVDHELSSSSSSSPENVGWAQMISPPRIDPYQNEAPEPFWEDICTSNGFYFVKAKAKINGDDGESSSDKIPQMEATCTMCSLLLQEEISVLKLKCRCKFMSLVHEKCYTHQFSANKKNEEDKSCDVCREIIKYIPVTLSRSDIEPDDLAVDSQMLESSNRHGFRSYLAMEADENRDKV